MKITKNQLKDKIQSSIQKATVTDEDLFELLSPYCDSDGKISLDNMILAMNTLNRDYSAKLLYYSLESILSEMDLLDSDNIETN